MLYQMIRALKVNGGWLCSATLLPALVACGSGDVADPVEDDATLGGSLQSLNGSGAPSGAHFNLNIIGTRTKTGVDASGGGRIFVSLQGSSRILLAEGAEFAVLDANGTDGAAQFQLPAADPDGDGVTNYEVFARALGKPGGSSTLTTCATDPATGEELCGAQALQLARSKGRQRFQNVSDELLFISVDLDGDGVIEELSLFDDALQDFFWQVDNTGLRLAQLRFYPVQ